VRALYSVVSFNLNTQYGNLIQLSPRYRNCLFFTLSFSLFIMSNTRRITRKHESYVRRPFWNRFSESSTFALHSAMHSPTASIYMKVDREDEVSCSISTISSGPSFRPPMTFLWSRKAWAEFAGISSSPQTTCFGGSPGHSPEIAPPGPRIRSRNTQLRHFAPSPNYLLPMSWHHIFLATPLLYGEYNFLPNVVRPNPRISVEEQGRIIGFATLNTVKPILCS